MTQWLNHLSPTDHNQTSHDHQKWGIGRASAVYAPLTLIIRFTVDLMISWSTDDSFEGHGVAQGCPSLSCKPCCVTCASLRGLGIPGRSGKRAAH